MFYDKIEHLSFSNRNFKNKAMSTDSKNSNEEIVSSNTVNDTPINNNELVSPNHQSILVPSPSKSDKAYLYDEEETIEVLEINDENHAVFKTLQGYSLFKLKENKRPYTMS